MKKLNSHRHDILQEQFPNKFKEYGNVNIRNTIDIQFNNKAMKLMLYSKLEEVSNSKMTQLVLRVIKIAHSQN